MSHDRDWMIKAKCRTGVDLGLYIADNRGRGRDAAARLEAACGGCRTVDYCAAYALKYDSEAGGMVWAGVPVPQSPNTKFWARAMAQLRERAGSVKL